MATTATVRLNLPYRIKQSEVKQLLDRGTDLDEIRRTISEEFILSAAHMNYPEGMPVRESRIFRGIKDALDNESFEITLDGTQFEFLKRLFLGETEQAKLKFKPAASSWLCDWIEYLEQGVKVIASG